MTKPLLQLACYTLPALLCHAAVASSCAPEQASVQDERITLYNEADCAKKAMASAATLYQDARRAEGMSDARRMCEAYYQAIMQLDNYQEGDWRKAYAKVAAELDRNYAELQTGFARTTCWQRINLYRHLAAKGNAWAMFNLGSASLKGDSLPRSDSTALDWYQKAAALGYTPAHLALGQMYSDGRAFQPDYKAAYDWFMKGAALGDAAAQYKVAEMLHTGQGVARNNAQAAEWYRKAAAQKHEGAQARLDAMYQSGEAKKPSSFW